MRTPSALDGGGAAPTTRIDKECSPFPTEWAATTAGPLGLGEKVNRVC